MTRLTRSVPGGPGQWSRGGWVNTTMSPDAGRASRRTLSQRGSGPRCQASAPWTQLGIEKVWNANARRPNVSASASARSPGPPGQGAAPRRRRLARGTHAARRSPGGPVRLRRGVAGVSSGHAGHSDPVRCGRGQTRGSAGREPPCRGSAGRGRLVRRVGHARRVGRRRRGQQRQRDTKGADRQQQRAHRHAKAPPRPGHQPRTGRADEVAPRDRARGCPVPDEQAGDLGRFVAMTATPAARVLI